MKKYALFFCASILALTIGCRSYSDEKDSINQLSDKINTDFLEIKKTTEDLALFTEGLYKNQKNAVSSGLESFLMMENGVYFKTKDNGGSAVFVSGAVPINKNIIDTVFFTEPIDTIFKQIITNNKSVVQAYYNDKNSYNRIYPFFDVLSQYQPGMTIPSFNFYYLADTQHNPEKVAVWVNEAYVDPAGRGWMVSCIAPVYYQNALEGVVGLDITIPRIAETYITEKDDYVMIVDNNGTIIYAFDYTINLFGFKKLVDHKYIETVKSDTFLRDDYNLFKSRSKEVRKMAESLLKNKNSDHEFINEKGGYHILCVPIKELGWYIFKVIEK